MDLVKVLDNIPNLTIPDELKHNIDIDEEEWKSIQSKVVENLKNDNYIEDREARSINEMMLLDLSEEQQKGFERFCTYIISEGNIEIIEKTLETVDNCLSVLSLKYKQRKEAQLKQDEEFKKKYEEEGFGVEPSIPLTIVHKEAMNFIGVHYTKYISKKDFPKFIREVYNKTMEISNIVAKNKIYGFAGVDSLGKDIVPQSIFSFVFAVQVSNIEDVPNDMISFTMPQHEYIFYKHVGSMNDLQRSINEVFMYDLKGNNYEMDLLPSFDIFPFDISDNDEFSEVEIYFPVSRIGGSTEQEM